MIHEFKLIIVAGFIGGIANEYIQRVSLLSHRQHILGYVNVIFINISKEGEQLGLIEGYCPIEGLVPVKCHNCVLIEYHDRKGQFAVGAFVHPILLLGEVLIGLCGILGEGENKGFYADPDFLSDKLYWGIIRLHFIILFRGQRVIWIGVHDQFVIGSVHANIDEGFLPLLIAKALL